jgi:polyvinyl alcohol dehydrogenase (cytochrome)
MPAWAVSSYVNQWQTIYPGSLSMTNNPGSHCQMCHLSASGGLNFNPYGQQIRNGLATLTFPAAVAAAEPLLSVSTDGTISNLVEITASSQPGWDPTSAGLPVGILGYLDPNTPTPTCTPPQVPQNGICVTPPPCSPPQVIQNGICVTPTNCTPPQVSQNGVCVTPLTCLAPQILSGGICIDPPLVCARPLVLQGGVCVSVVVPTPPTPSRYAPADVTACGGGWPMAGYDIHNTRFATTERQITAANVHNLTLLSTGTMADSVLPTLTTQGNYVYAPDRKGNLSKIDLRTGKATWTVKGSTLTGQATTILRPSPTLCSNMVIVAGWSVDLTGPSTAYVMALSQSTGQLIWKTLVDTDQAARIYQSPIIYKGTIYIGVAGVAAEINSFLKGAGQPAPTFRGSIIALNLSNGHQLWKTYTVPAGYSGGGVWGNTLSIDEDRGVLYAGIGNNYSIPPASMACIFELGGDAGNLCTSPDNHIDGIMALDLASGSIIWHKQIIPWDAYGCGVNCPTVAGAPDYDFPVGPQLFTIEVGGQAVDVVGAGHKNGAYIALNRATGDIVWAQKTGPASPLGGIERECAVDGGVIYCPEMNWANETATLIDGTVTTGGFWTALRATDGVILWQKANPTGFKALSPMTVISGVVFGCSLDPTGMCYAFDVTNGNILWQYATGGSNGGGVSVSNGRIFVGVGYGGLDPYINLGGSGNKVLTFSLPSGGGGGAGGGGGGGGGGGD